MLSLTHNGVPYLTPTARARDADPEELTASALATWEVIARKWRTIPGGLDLITDEDHPIGFRRRMIRETRGIQLPSR